MSGLPCKVAILGSCVTRDAFSFLPSPAWEVGKFVARTSFISMCSPPLVIDKTFSAPSDFESRSIKADFLKTGWSILDEAFDYLIIDFIDDRFDLIEIDESYVLATVTMTQSGVLDGFPNRRAVPRLADSTTAMWERDCKVFCQRLRQKIDPAKVILHKARHASHYSTENGLEPFSGFHAQFYAKHNPILESYYRFFSLQLPEAKIIDLPQGLVVGNQDHPWGRQPFHYVGEYYSNFLESLSTAVSKT